MTSSCYIVFTLSSTACPKDIHWFILFWFLFIIKAFYIKWCDEYRQTFIISHMLVGNTIVDHSDVVGAAPFHLHFHCRLNTWFQWIWAKTTERRDDKQLRFGIWCNVNDIFYGIFTFSWKSSWCQWVKTTARRDDKQLSFWDLVAWY